MSIASPTFRSSSSTVPGPSFKRSPISIRARPSTAETCTGTSNTASRSEAMRLVAPSGSGACVGSIGMPPLSRLGSGILLSSLILRPPQYFLCRREVAAGADIAGDRFADRCVGRRAVAVDAAVSPFNAAVADLDIRLGEHHQPALVMARAHDVLEHFLGGGVERVVDAHGDMRCGNKLAETLARQRGDFRERLPGEQRRR